MAEFSWPSRSPLEHALVPGAHGARSANPVISLAELRDFDLVQVMARRGRWTDVANAAKAVFGAAPPDAPKAVQSEDAVLIWSGPDQFQVLSNSGGRYSAAALGPSFSGMASLSDQSHARVLIRVSGPKARSMLAKLSSIDLHPASFPPGSAAATSMDHTSINLWRGADLDDGEAVFNLLLLATFSESLWRTMLDAAAEYGVEVAHPDDAWAP